MKQREESVACQWLLAAVANMPVLAYGLEAGWLSSAGRALRSATSPAGAALPAELVAWLASVLCLAAVPGSYLGAVAADRLGRKYSLVLTSAPQAISWGMRLVWTSGGALLLARTLSGISAGACFVVPVMYIREISATTIRGSLTSTVLLSCNFGLLIMYILSAIFDYATIIWLMTPLPVLHILLMLLAPESPAYLVKRGKFDEASRTLATLRGLDVHDKRVEGELLSLMEENDNSRRQASVSLCSIWRDAASRRALLVCVMLFGLQAASGVMSVLTHAASLLQDAGLALAPETQAIAVGACFAGGCVLTMLLVEKLGRKPLLLTSMALLAASLGALGLPAALRPLGLPAPPPWLPALLLSAIVFSYSVGLTSVPFVICAEVFSFEARGTATGFLVSLSWLLCFVQLQAFSPLYLAFGDAAFVIFCAANVAGMLAVVRFVPETKGRSFQQIQAHFRREKVPLSSLC